MMKKLGLDLDYMLMILFAVLIVILFSISCVMPKEINVYMGGRHFKTFQVDDGMQDIGTNGAQSDAFDDWLKG